MGPGGEGGGVHEVRERVVGLSVIRELGALESKTKRMRQRETIITSDNDSYCPQRCRLILLNFSGVNSGQVLRDDWKKRSTSE